MRLRILSLIFTFCFASQVFAISPLTTAQQEQAQLYGKSQAQLKLTEFLRPWCSFEEGAASLSETEECAYLYTRYLLIANDAREKTLAKQTVKIDVCQEIMDSYADTLSFSVKLYGNYEQFIKGTGAEIVQNGKAIKPFQNVIPEKAVSFVSVGKNAYGAQCYFYFDETELDLTKPVILSVVSGDGNTHQFFFDLTKIK